MGQWKTSLLLSFPLSVTLQLQTKQRENWFRKSPALSQKLTLAHLQCFPPAIAFAWSSAGERTPCRAAPGNSWLAQWLRALPAEFSPLYTETLVSPYSQGAYFGSFIFLLTNKCAFTGIHRTAVLCQPVPAAAYVGSWAPSLPLASLYLGMCKT